MSRTRRRWQWRPPTESQHGRQGSSPFAPARFVPRRDAPAVFRRTLKFCTVYRRQRQRRLAAVGAIADFE
jgi:hypothetical protein